MNKRPLSVTAISWIFISVGCIGLVRGVLPLVKAAASRDIARNMAQEAVDAVIVSTISLLAVVGGAYALRGLTWARWLLVLWMGIHIILSLMHSSMEVLVHSVIFAAILYILFRPPPSAYFRSASRRGTVGPDER